MLVDSPGSPAVPRSRRKRRQIRRCVLLQPNMSQNYLPHTRQDESCGGDCGAFRTSTGLGRGNKQPCALTFLNTKRMSRSIHQVPSSLTKTQYAS